MSGEVSAAIVAAFAGFGVAYFTLRTQITQVRMQMDASHRSEIVKRQLDAVESVWSIFDAASHSGGDGRILQTTNIGHAVSIENALAFIRRLEDTFNSKSGLYLSKKARQSLFAFRDFIRTDLVGDLTTGLRPISEQKYNSFFEKRRFVRLCLRAEIGSTDLRVSQEELHRYEAGDKSR